MVKNINEMKEKMLACKRGKIGGEREEKKRKFDVREVSRIRK